MSDLLGRFHPSGFGPPRGLGTLCARAGDRDRHGVDIVSADWSDPASRHAVYSEAGECPESHPVHIPQLQFALDYPPVAADDLGGLALSSGDIHSGHADFWNTWDQAKLQNEVSQCIHRDLVCSVSS